ncbi:MAG: efflux RND transporter permease subunit [Bacteroidota bacterium]
MSFTEKLERHPRAILFTIVILSIAGITAALNLPVSIFPDINFPRIVVLADNGEDPAERVMVTLTKPLEEAINSVPGVRNVRSKTARGAVEISINFDWGTDIILCQQLLQAKISSIRNQLPPTANVTVERMNATFFPIMGFSLTSDTLSLVELRDLALYTVRPALSRIRGVAQVRIVGGRTREFLVTIDPLKLAAYHLDIRQVSDALQKTNLVAAVGFMDANFHLNLTLVDNMYASLYALQNSVVTTRGNTPVILSDIAAVTPNEKDEYIRVTADNKEAVLINILRQPEGNSVQIAVDVKKALTDLRYQIPPQVHISNFYDESLIINDSLDALRDSILIGVGLAIIILIIFLRSTPLTLIAGLVIPVTVAITLLMLYVFNQTLNIMTLGGIAGSIGLIIDDVIVIAENAFRHAEREKVGIMEGIRESVPELLPAVIGSSAATIVIHIPFAFLSGVTGAFFRSLSLTMALTLIISFFLSIIFVPLLMRLLIRMKTDTSHETLAEGKIYFWYKQSLRFLLAHRKLVIPVIIFLLAGSYVLYTQIGSEFMPSMDEGAFILDYVSPPGTSLNETHRMLNAVENIITSIPEVETYSRRTGTELGFFLTEPNSGDMLIKLKKQRKRSADEIIDELRDRIQTSQPALRIEFGQAIQDLVGDLTNVPSPIEIKVFGENRTLIESTAKSITRTIDTVRGVVDAFNGITISGPAYVLNFDEKAIGRAGLTVGDLQEILQNDIQGSIATNIQKGEKLIGVRVRLPDSYRTRAENLANLRILSPNGSTYLLGTLASIVIDPGQSEIARENLKQMVAVTARLSGRDLGSTIQDIQEQIRDNVILPPGVTLTYGGTYETEQESFLSLTKILAAASLLVFLVLILEFESLSIPIWVYFITILSLFGVLFALWVTDVNLNISSFMGCILIVGIVAENGIFLVHFFRKFQKTGMSYTDALVEAGAIRFRPIIMTAFAAIFALLPLAIGLGAGAQMQQPLAIAIIGGFSLSSILLLYILPVLLSIRFKKELPKNDKIAV